MTGPQVDIRLTGPREDCELALAELRRVFQMDRSGPACDRSAWPMVHMHLTARLTTDPNGGAHADRH